MQIMKISVYYFLALMLSKRDSYRNRHEAEMVLKGSALYVYVKDFHRNHDAPQHFSQKLIVYLMEYLMPPLSPRLLP